MVVQTAASTVTNSVWPVILPVPPHLASSLLTWGQGWPEGGESWVVSVFKQEAEQSLIRHFSFGLKIHSRCWNVVQQRDAVPWSQTDVEVELIVHWLLEAPRPLLDVKSKTPHWKALQGSSFCILFPHAPRENTLSCGRSPCKWGVSTPKHH